MTSVAPNIAELTMAKREPLSVANATKTTKPIILRSRPSPCVIVCQISSARVKLFISLLYPSGSFI